MFPRARAAFAALVLGVSGMAGVLLHSTAAEAATGPGYMMVDDAGHIYPFGSAPFCGHSDMVFSHKATDVEITPNNQGYWILIDDGYVDFKNCGMSSSDYLNYEHNNIVPLAAGEKAVSLSALPDGTGYWVFTDRGKVLPFGNAQFFGDMSNVALNGPVLGSVATPSGKGYWMVGSDGGIFNFGDAKFSGSTGGIKLNKPVMSMAPDPDGLGYWLVASDGGIFAFDAPFKGSMGATRLNKPVSGMVPGSNGYMMVGEDGGIFSFGDVAFLGSLGATPPSSRIGAVSLWTDVTLNRAITPPTPPKPAPTYQWTTVLDAYAATSEDETPRFTTSGPEQSLVYLCDQNGGAYSYGCSFRIVRASDGGYMDSLMPDAFTGTRVKTLHLPAGTYYIEGDEFGDKTIWGVTIDDNQCTANCV